MRQSVLEQKLSAIVIPVLADHGARLVHLEYTSGTLQVMVEGQDGSRMGVDDFANISRDLSPALEVEDPIKGPYRLEVSSPGIDRPLVRPEDYERHAGFEAKLELEVPIEGSQKRYRGFIKSFADNVITLQTDTGETAIPFDMVSKAKLVLTDHLIQSTKEKQKNA
jgi:ribosome maturation factor RimP